MPALENHSLRSMSRILFAAKQLCTVLGMSRILFAAKQLCTVLSMSRILFAAKQLCTVLSMSRILFAAKQLCIVLGMSRILFAARQLCIVLYLSRILFQQNIYKYLLITLCSRLREKIRQHMFSEWTLDSLPIVKCFHNIFWCDRPLKQPRRDWEFQLFWMQVTWYQWRRLTN